MNVANLQASMSLNISNFVTGMKAASSQWKAFTNSVQWQTKSLSTGLDKMASGYKDVGRIAQGIFVSQAIYRTVNAITDAAASVWDFANNLEYAEMAYSNLFGSASLSKEFMNVIQDFAAVTPFNVKDLEKSTRLLTAYGIEAKNIMYVTKGALTAAAGQEDPEAATRIARALGQIYTKNKLMAEEARQLTEAGVPVYKILQEELGLTTKQLSNLGKEAIPAATAINAIVDGINKRFGNLLEDSSRTLTGILSNMQDNFLIIGAQMFEPARKALKTFLSGIGSDLANLASIVNKTGIGGVFEAIVPKELQADLRLLISNLMLLASIIRGTVLECFKLLGNTLAAMLPLINSLLTIFTSFISVLNALITPVMQNEQAVKVLTVALAVGAAAWLLWNSRAVAAFALAGLAKVFNIITTAVVLTTKALTVLATHPIWALVTIAGAGLLGLAASSDKVKNSLNGMLGSMTKASGIDPNKLLLPSQKERTADLEKFNQKLDGTADGMDKLAKNTGKAKKAAENLQSFDEVFTIKDPDENAAGEGLDPSLGGISMPEIDLGGGMPSAADFAAFGKNFVSKLLDSLKPFMDDIFAAGLGALIGRAIGGILGGPIGAIIGTALGALAGWLWNQLADYLGLTLPEKLGIGIGAGLGAAIGAIIGGPAGAAIGAAIGGLVGWIAGLLYDGFVNGNWNWGHISIAVGTGIGAAIGAIVGGPAGAVIGTAVGALVGYVGSLLIKGFETGSWDFSKITTIVGGLIGAAIGAIVGGPVGAAIGAAIGGVVGWIVGYFIDGFQENKWDSSQITSGFGKALAGAISVVTLGPIGALLLTSITSVANWITNQIEQQMGGTTTFFDTMWARIVGIFEGSANKSNEALNPLAKGIEDFFTALGLNLDNGEIRINSWLDVLLQRTEEGTAGLNIKWSKLFVDLMTSFGTFNFDTVKKMGTMWDELVERHDRGAELLRTKFTNFWEDVKEIHRLAAELIVTRLANKWEEQRSIIETKLAAIQTNIRSAWDAIWIYLEPLFKKVADAVHLRWGDMSTDIERETGKSKSAIEYGWDAMSNTIVGKTLTMAAQVAKSFLEMSQTTKKDSNDASSSAIKAFTDMNAEVVKKVVSMASETKTALDKMLNDFTTWVQSLWTGVFQKLFGWLDEGMTKIKDFLSAQIDAEKAEKKARDREEKEDKANSGPGSSSSGYVNSGPGVSKKGHALGGVFNKEHWAPFAEGNKAEAIIPLENDTAMQPFSNAVSDSVIASLAPIIASLNNSNNGVMDDRRPLYVNTLIADQRGLKELNRKLRIIEAQESTRGL